MAASRSRARDRHDRHVSRLRLGIAAGSPAHLLELRVEEALRLCTLPGEETGRVYHFRRLHVAGLPVSGERRVWLAAFQHELTQLARDAVHGMDGQAALRDAVFFHNRAEACQALLGLLLRRKSTEAWFWPAVSASRPGAPAADRLIDLIESLRASPAAWSAVAAAIFGAIGADDAGALLGLLPDAWAARWLCELGGFHAPAPLPFAAAAAHITLADGSAERPPGDPGEAWGEAWGVAGGASAAVTFPGPTRTILERAAAAHGWNDCRVVWLAALGVVLARPAELERGTVVALARASLFVLALTAPRPGPAPGQGEAKLAATDPLRILQASLAVDAADPVRTAVAMAPAPIETRQASPIGGARRQGMSAAIRSEAARELAAPAGARGRCLGQATNGAGLYFLLNALRRLQTHADPFEPCFLAQFFLHVAHHAGIEASDPILLWAREHWAIELWASEIWASEIWASEIWASELWASEVIEQPGACASPGACPSPGASASNIRRVRRCAVQVRRWCWRTAQISVGEIVRRPGEVTLTPSELDVSLPLDQADIRIRRVGLDLDPGWLPWFGRVVRFHYLTPARLGVHPLKHRQDWVG